MKLKNVELIYDYMGWEVCSGRLYPCPRCTPIHYEMKDYDKPLDSNSAWECVQEIERKGDGREFYYFIEDMICNKCYIYEYPSWIMNPTNFFNCMAKWLEGIK